MVFNQMFEQGVFPTLWKQACILPLIKKPTPDLDDRANYRPISRLPLPAKIVEKIMNVELSNFMLDNQILDSSQSGFRANPSMETALIKTTEEIRMAVDSGGSAALTLLDLSEAFDTVDHRLLVQRLNARGVQGKALALFKSFLSERSQTLNLGQFKSSPFPLPCGFPRAPP